MTGKRRRHSAEFKAKLALEALKGLKTVNELAAEYGVHPTQISQCPGRAAGYPTAPPQTRASAINAPGSSGYGFAA